MGAPQPPPPPFRLGRWCATSRRTLAALVTAGTLPCEVDLPGIKATKLASFGNKVAIVYLLERYAALCAAPPPSPRRWCMHNTKLDSIPYTARSRRVGFANQARLSGMACAARNLTRGSLPTIATAWCHGQWLSTYLRQPYE